MEVIKNARLDRDGGDDSHSGTGPCPKCGSGARNLEPEGSWFSVRGQDLVGCPKHSES